MTFLEARKVTIREVDWDDLGSRWECIGDTLRVGFGGFEVFMGGVGRSTYSCLLQAFLTCLEIPLCSGTEGQGRIREVVVRWMCGLGSVEGEGQVDVCMFRGWCYPSLYGT